MAFRFTYRSGLLATAGLVVYAVTGWAGCGRFSSGPRSDGAGVREAGKPSSVASKRTGPRTGKRVRTVVVPQGPFVMGSDTGQQDEQPAAVVWVKRFSIQVYEVTRGEYRKCVIAGTCTARPFPPGRDGNLPVTGVSYRDAMAYCAFVGMRLPDEAEWEKAARYVDGRRYPWGDEPDCRMANFGNYDDQAPCSGVNPGRVLPGGRRPAGVSGFGVHDMAGNVWEWVKPSAGLGRASVPRGWALLKGGSATSIFILPRSSNRLSLPEDYRDADIGFRCAADTEM